MPTRNDSNYIVRGIAAVLALGGIVWGAILLASFGLWALFPLPFGVGYILTAGYLFRAFDRLSPRLRQAVWLLSISTQGLFFVYSLPELASKPVLPVWWGFAAAASALALRLEVSLAKGRTGDFRDNR
jgi:hypothetical protein